MKSATTKSAKPAPELTDAQLAARVKQLPQMREDLKIQRESLKIQRDAVDLAAARITQLQLIGGLLALKNSGGVR